jgi:hypothetical protein
VVATVVVGVGNEEVVLVKVGKPVVVTKAVCVVDGTVWPVQLETTKPIRHDAKVSRRT